MFVKRFKEEGRLQYGKEMGKTAASDSMKCSDTSRSNGRQADTVDLVMKLLFDHIAPPLLEARNLSKLIAYVWKWVYVPNLEGNVQWVKEALAHFFSIDDARVVLSDKMVGGGRVHSVVKMFKKYGTQSAIRTLKNLEIKRWGFSIEVNKYVRKDNTMPRCADSERWAVYEIGGYLDDRTRNMMRRNGGDQFLVRHYRNVGITEGEVFKSNLHNAVQLAFNRGCDQEEVAEQLREVIATAWRKEKSSVLTIHRNQMKIPTRFQSQQWERQILIGTQFQPRWWARFQSRRWERQIITGTQFQPRRWEMGVC